MKYLLFLILFALASCESHNFERDKRQILAKDEIRKQLRGFRQYSIIAFKEDTLPHWTDSVVLHPIRYTLDIVCSDSLGNLQSKKGVVLFTPVGNAILRSDIIDNQ